MQIHLIKHLLTKVNTVISESQGFLYAKSPKTAGTSIYRATIEKHISDSFLLDLNRSYKFKHKLFKFTIVRNPWDKLVSNFSYCNKLKYANTPINFSDFITFLEDGKGSPNLKAHCRPIHDYFLLSDKQWVDFIGRFENLENDWRYICSKMTNFSRDLPITNTTIHDNYQTYYTTKDIERVYNMYKIEIDYLGYTF